jgi:nitroimidazol reductase NimA-like FMN-containing flavoprotein (pyridoxamine 5'-phosphate oxidase superfamily)
VEAQELAAELDHPDAQQLLRHGVIARLAYNGGDGFPRVAPTGFL